MTIDQDTTAIAERLQLCLPNLTRDWQERDRLEELALDSLDTVELLCAIHEEFGVQLTDQEFHPQQTVAGLLEKIAMKVHPKQSIS